MQLALEMLVWVVYGSRIEQSGWWRIQMLSMTLSAFAGASLYVGSKAYKQIKRDKEIVPFLTPNRQARKSNRKPIKSLLKTLNTSLLGDSRSRQLEELSTTNHGIEISDAEKKARRDLITSSIALSLAIAGALFYAPLSLFSVLNLAHRAPQYYRDAYDSLIVERRIKVVIIDIVTILALLSLQLYVLLAVALTTNALGRLLLYKTQDRSKKNLTGILGEQSRSAWVVMNDVEIELPLEKVQTDDIIVVNTGQVIPVDGTITGGIAAVDQHMLTGEAQPVEKESGDTVFASTVVLTGKIYVRVDKAGEETAAAQISRILSHTVDFKTAAQTRGEVLVDRLPLPILGLGGLALFTLGPLGVLPILNAQYSLQNLRLLAPLGMLNFLNIASQRGILVKDGRALEVLSQVDTFVFDKTGTLTYEQPHVGKIYAFAQYDEDDILTYAAAAEQKQSHPIAKAILQEAHERQLARLDIDHADYKVGYGLSMIIDGRQVRVGSPRFMELEKLAMPRSVTDIVEQSHGLGYSLVMVAIDDTVAGGIELHSTVRPEAKRVIEDLKQRGIKSIHILSGDHEMPTGQLAATLGIDSYFAEALPENKADLIERMRSQGHVICYVGDGINDAIALQKADVSVSLRGATTVAVDAAQIILMNERLDELPQLLDIAQDFRNTMSKTFLTVLAPMVFTIGGAFLMHLGLIHSLILNQMGLVAGAGQVVWPLKHYQQEEIEIAAKSVEGMS